MIYAKLSNITEDPAVITLSEEDTNFYYILVTKDLYNIKNSKTLEVVSFRSQSYK